MSVGHAMKPISEAHFAIRRRHTVEVGHRNPGRACERGARQGGPRHDVGPGAVSQIMADAMEALGMTFTSLPLIWRDPAQVSRRRAGGREHER
jgi:hypothetical protein